MKSYNQQGNVINVSQLFASLEVVSRSIAQIVFFEYNNFDEIASPNQLMFCDWKDVENLLVVVPEHWLSDTKFRMKFEGSRFHQYKKDICLYYDGIDEKEKEFRKELRQRVGYSLFADFYNNYHVGEFNLSKFVRNDRWNAR